MRKDLGTYVQLNIDSMSYYCWHHPWGEYVGRQNNKPLSFYVSGWNVLLMCMSWVLAIIEEYMMVEYVELLLKLCWISWIAIAWYWEHRLLGFKRIHRLNLNMWIGCHYNMRNFMRKNCCYDARKSDWNCHWSNLCTLLAFTLHKLFLLSLTYSRTSRN